MRKLDLLAGLLLSFLLGAPELARAAAPEPPPERVRVHTESAADGNGVAVTFAATVTAPAASVVQVLDDLEALPTWLPRMKSTARLASPPEAATDTVRFESVLGLPWPVGEVRETMAVRRETEGEVVRLRWDHIEGSMRRNQVVWTVTPLDTEHTEVRYDANLWFQTWVPVFLIRLAERGYAPWFVDCLERRAATVAAAAAPPRSAASNPPPPTL